MNRTGMQKDLVRAMIPPSIPTAFVKQFLISYFINTTPIDRLEDVLKANRIDTTIELEAVEAMRHNTNADDISAEDGIKYFDLQYGELPFEQFINLFNEFEELPSEMTANHKFVTQGFVDAEEQIKDEEIDSCIQFTLEDRELSRLPKNYWTIKKLTQVGD